MIKPRVKKQGLQIAIPAPLQKFVEDSGLMLRHGGEFSMPKAAFGRSGVESLLNWGP